MAAGGAEAARHAGAIAIHSSAARLSWRASRHPPRRRDRRALVVRRRGRGQRGSRRQVCRCHASESEAPARAVPASPHYVTHSEVRCSHAGDSERELPGSGRGRLTHSAACALRHRSESRRHVGDVSESEPPAQAGAVLPIHSSAALPGAAGAAAADASQ
jgi:hypothetical protein